METRMVIYDEACRLLSQAHTIDEVKEFRDKMEAMRAYARQILNRDAEIHASEIRVRAERRLGQMLAALPSKKQQRQKCLELGITLHQMRGSLRLAVMEEGSFNKNMAAWRKEVLSLPPATLMRMPLSREKYDKTHRWPENPVKKWRTPPSLAYADALTGEVNRQIAAHQECAARWKRLRDMIPFHCVTHDQRVGDVLMPNQIETAMTGKPAPKERTVVALAEFASLGEFLASRTEEGAEYRVQAAVILKAFNVWMATNNRDVWGHRMFAKGMVAYGYSKRQSGVIFYLGLRLQGAAPYGNFPQGIHKERPQ
jgi:hypothetical protein